MSGPGFDVEARTIFVTLAGSQAHGTAREGSDVDLRGVCVAPLSIRLSLFHGFEQREGPLEGALADAIRARVAAHPSASRGLGVKTEAVVFDVAKLLRLAVQANPNALEILFADERDWLHETLPWRALHDARYGFLTKKVQATFLGYALAQLKRIETHRAWVRSPPTHRPERQEFGLPAQGALSRDDVNRIEAAIAPRLRGYGVDDVEMPKPTRVLVEERMTAFYADALAAREDELEDRTRAVATHAMGLPEDVVTALEAEKKYRRAMKRWESYRTWKVNRNPARAALEARFGYDTKHAMHLVRLMRMGIEALETGELHVRRPDAEELIAIRDGALSFEALREEASALAARMKDAAVTTRLPSDVDEAAVDRLALALMHEER